MTFEETAREIIGMQAAELIQAKRELTAAYNTIEAYRKVADIQDKMIDLMKKKLKLEEQ